MLSHTLTSLLCMTCPAAAATATIHASTYNHTHNHIHSCDHKHNEKAFMLADDDLRTKDGARTRKHKQRKYCVDSGASVHCINDASRFEHAYEAHPQVKVTVANKQVLTAQAVGTVKVSLTNQHNQMYLV